MRIEPLGDQAILLRDLPAKPAELARAINAHLPDGILEAVAAYDTLAIYAEAGFDFATFGLPEPVSYLGQIHTIPVLYQGPDLNDVADILGISVSEVIQDHTATAFECFAIGFQPGFPYLGHLPERYAAVARLPTPRVHVEAGSVGIAGCQTGIYAMASPGGWRIIGNTPITLVDVEADYFPVRAGDRVRFVSISESEWHQLRAEPRSPGPSNRPQ